MKKVAMMISTILLFGVLIIFSSVGVCEETSGNTLYAGGSGDGNYSSIQEAINASSDGDTIFVYSGTYTENIVINKSISLIGENNTNTILSGALNNNVRFPIYVISVNANNVSISDLTIKDNDCGIITENSNNNTITNNIFMNISSLLGGIFLVSSVDNTLKDNNFINTGLIISGTSRKNIVLNNYVNGKSLIYLEDESNKVIEEAGQVILLYCNNITIKNQNISNINQGIEIYNSKKCIISGNYISENQYGLSISESNNITVFGNTFFYNGEGIYLKNSEFNILAYNNISKNNGTCIYLDHSVNNQISNNSISNNNGTGIYLGTASGNNLIIGNTISFNKFNGIDLYVEYCIDSINLIYHNNFIRNFYDESIGESINADESCSHNWYNSSLRQGNYWDDYTGLDKNNDGIGDEPYKISDGENADEYPLMMPYDGTIRLKEFYVDEGPLYTMLIVGIIVAILFCLPIAYVWYRKYYKVK